MEGIIGNRMELLGSIQITHLCMHILRCFHGRVNLVQVGCNLCMFVNLCAVLEHRTFCKCVKMLAVTCVCVVVYAYVHRR